MRERFPFLYYIGLTGIGGAWLFVAFVSCSFLLLGVVEPEAVQVITALVGFLWIIWRVFLYAGLGDKNHGRE